jgi:membrane fusion protein (multidrug efflux system)
MKQSTKHGGLAAGILLMAMIISFVLSQQKEPLRRRPFAEADRPLSLMTVKLQDIQPEIRMTGPLTAYHRVDLYAEVSGILQPGDPPFRAGVAIKKDSILLKIDDRVYRNNVLAQRSSLLNELTLFLPDFIIDFPDRGPVWENYLKDYGIHQNLKPLPEAVYDQERYYIASRNIYQQYYSIKSMEETLFKYTIRAPFDGIISMTDINPGTLIRAGQKLGEFVGTDLFEVEASVTLDEAQLLVPGQPVLLTTEDMPGSFQGIIRRINSVIDPASMTVKVYIHSRDNQLRDGLYMIGIAHGLPVTAVVPLKRDLLTEGSVYVVEDSVLTLKPITVTFDAGEQVLVRGLKDGMVVLNEVWTEARPGKRLPGHNPDIPDMKRGPFQ